MRNENTSKNLLKVSWISSLVKVMTYEEKTHQSLKNYYTPSRFPTSPRICWWSILASYTTTTHRTKYTREIRVSRQRNLSFEVAHWGHWGWRRAFRNATKGWIFQFRDGAKGDDILYGGCHAASRPKANSLCDDLVFAQWGERGHLCGRNSVANGRRGWRARIWTRGRSRPDVERGRAWPPTGQQTSTFENWREKRSREVGLI